MYKRTPLSNLLCTVLLVIVPSIGMLSLQVSFADDCLSYKGDFDCDRDVDGSDLAVFAKDFGRTDCTGDCAGDFDTDADVDDSDLALFAVNFGRTDYPNPERFCKQWAIAYGGSAFDDVRSIDRTADGAYLVVGNTGSFGAADRDICVSKLWSDGSIMWQKRYGGDNDEHVRSYWIRETADNGYIVAYETDSVGSGRYDMWVLKLNYDGTIAWQKVYGGVTFERDVSIEQTSEGGYIVAGSTFSFGIGWYDIGVLKLDSDGTVAWGKTYGGRGIDYATSVQQTEDGGYLLAGYTDSFGSGKFDLWLVKLASDGSIVWQRTYGGSDNDRANFVQQTQDGGYIAIGDTITYGLGWIDMWALKLDGDGSVSWAKTYGGSSSDSGSCIRQTHDGGYIAAGNTDSFGPVQNSGWLLKLREDGTVIWEKTYGEEDERYDIRSVQLTEDTGYIVGGHASNADATVQSAWVAKLDSHGEIPGCSIVGESEAIVYDASVEVVDTTVEPQDFVPTFSDTNISAHETAGEWIQICCHEVLGTADMSQD